MSQSLSNVLVHVVYSTKDRRPLLVDPDVRRRLHQELGGVSNTLGCQSLVVGGVADHVHLLARQARTISLSDWVKELKRTTSAWMKEQGRQYVDFAWQAGYGAFSVSPSQVPRVRRYIGDQEEHHRTIDFQSELRRLLERNQIEFDEQFLWG